MRKALVITLLLILGGCNNTLTTDDLNRGVIKQRVGESVQFYCGIKLNHMRFLVNSRVQWYFKFCREEFAKDFCYDRMKDEWIKLSCEQTFCKPTLTLKNLTGYQSGLYKCNITPYQPNNITVLQIQLVRYFQLEVEDLSVPTPEIIEDNPKNKTSQIGYQVVFECRVYSEVHLTIKWFRRILLPNINETSTTVQYFKNTYELLDSPRERILTDDCYFSKLVLNNISRSDIGYYACVAINYRGYKIREAYLDIIEENNASSFKFLFLFLFPIVLSVPPIAIWIGFLCCKRYRRDESIPLTYIKMNHLHC